MSKYLVKGFRFGLAGLVVGGAAFGQNGPQITEDGEATAVAGAQSNVGAGPVRLARISFLRGQVSWRENSSSPWMAAAVNMPLREGAQIWTTDRARAEVQFDDGSYLRLGGVRRDEGGVITLQTLYSDAQGEFTEIALNSGLVSLRLTNPKSLYQVDTEALAAKAYGPTDLRVGEGRGVEVVDHHGDVNVKNTQGDTSDLKDGESLYVTDGSSQMMVATMPGLDSWDRFVAERDAAISGQVANLPANIALCAGELNGAGTWQDSQYGSAWYPTVNPGWAPYRDGRWVWVQPFGWTWCANESWGWAPYHYGTWFNTNRGWAWAPGPATQCWSPAVVHFSTDNGRVGWCPLAPSEVRYSDATVGVWRNGWTLSFSIGSVCNYYPGRDNVCNPVYFQNTVVNHQVNVETVTTINNYYGSAPISGNHFVPVNSRRGSGASYVAAADFGELTTSSAAKDSGIFEHGQSFAPNGNRLVSGPPGVKVISVSLRPNQTESGGAPMSSVLQRPIFRPVRSTQSLGVGSVHLGSPSPLRERVESVPVKTTIHAPVANPFVPPVHVRMPVNQPPKVVHPVGHRTSVKTTTTTTSSSSSGKPKTVSGTGHDHSHDHDKKSGS